MRCVYWLPKVTPQETSRDVCPLFNCEHELGVRRRWGLDASDVFVAIFVFISSPRWSSKGGHDTLGTGLQTWILKLYKHFVHISTFWLPITSSFPRPLNIPTKLLDMIMTKSEKCGTGKWGAHVSYLLEPGQAGRRVSNWIPMKYLLPWASALHFDVLTCFQFKYLCFLSCIVFLCTVWCCNLHWLEKRKLYYSSQVLRALLCLTPTCENPEWKSQQSVLYKRPGWCWA